MNSGYHGQVGRATRQQEWTERRGTEFGRSQQGTEGELPSPSKEEDIWIH